MTKFADPYQLAQAHLVFEQLLLDIKHGNQKALTSFCNDPASPVRKRVTSLFVKEESEVVAKKIDEPLLRPMAIGSFPAISRFSSMENFGGGNALGMKFSLGPNFIANFMGMVEGNVPARDVASARLTRKATNADIRKALGDREEMLLAHFHYALANHGTGSKSDGFLLANGEQNISFVADKNGIPWPVYSRLINVDVWAIEAFPDADQAPWGPDSHIFYVL